MRLWGRAVVFSFFISQFGQLRAEVLHSKICSKVLDRLFQNHHTLTKKVYDSQSDELSEFAFNHILKDLDPDRIYLSQSDLEAWRSAGVHHHLDDAMNTCNVTLISDFLSLLKTRIQQHVDLLKMEGKQIVENPEAVSKLVLSSQSIDFEPDDASRLVRLREMTRYKLIRAMARGMEEAKAIQGQSLVLEKVHQHTDTLGELDKISILVDAMLAKLDPHTKYFNPKELKAFTESIAGRLVGVGVQLESKEGKIFIKGVLKGGPADKEGTLKAGDEVLAIGSPGKGFHNVQGLKLEVAGSLFRGDEGSVVILKVQRAEAQDPIEITITRGVVESPESKPSAYTVEFPEEEADGKPDNVAVIRIPEFNEGTAVQVAHILKEQLGINPDNGTSDEIDVVVIDLRGNGGGLLDEAISLTGLFITQGPVVQLKKNGTNLPEIYADDDYGQILWSGPLVVATDYMSASASEIFAGAIKDHGRGIILGEGTTYGKGSVQNIEPLCKPIKVLGVEIAPAEEDLGGVKTTICMFYRINGVSTQHLGVESDFVIPSPLTDNNSGEASLSSSLPPANIDPVDDSELSSDNRVVSGELLSAFKITMTEITENRLKSDGEYKKYHECLSEFEKLCSDTEVTYSLSLLKERMQRESELKKSLEIDDVSQTKRLDSEGVLIDESTNDIISAAMIFTKLSEYFSLQQSKDPEVSKK